MRTSLTQYVTSGFPSPTMAPTLITWPQGYIASIILSSHNSCNFKIIFSEFLPYLTKQTNDGKISNHKNSLDRTICIPALPSRRTRTGRGKRRPGSSPSTTTFARDRLIFCSVVGPTNTAMMDVTIVWLKGLSRRISNSRATA